MVLDIDFLEEQLEFIKRKKNDPDLEWQDLADMRSEHYGVKEHRDTTRKGSKLLLEYIDNGWNVTNPSSGEKKCSEENRKCESFEYKNDGTGVSDKLIEISEGEDITPESMLRYHGLSSERWKVMSYKNNYWHTQQKNSKRVMMYQSKLTVAPYGKDELSPDEIKKWFEQFKPKEIQHKPTGINYGIGDNCLLLPIVDLHYNLLSTKFISGNDYNCQIAENRLYNVVEDVLNRVHGKKFNKIYFPIGNDLFNANGINGETFKGTKQDNERHIFEAYTKLFEIMTDVISKLAEIAPVEIIYIPSNHDKEITYYFVYNLFTYYRLDERVSIDCTPINNKYKRFGNTLMVFAHDAKMNDMGNIVLDEGIEHIGGAKYVEVFLAHLHKEIVNQEKNVTIRRLPTFSGKSAWANDNNFGSNQVSQTFIINENKNITDILYTTV